MSAFWLGLAVGAVAVGVPAVWLVLRLMRALAVLETAMRDTTERLQRTASLFGRRAGGAL